MNCSFADNTVEKLKETVVELFEQGGDIMPTIVQQIRTEVENEFENKVKEVRNKDREEIAKRMIQKGMDVDTIVEITGVSREKLEKFPKRGTLLTSLTSLTTLT